MRILSTALLVQKKHKTIRKILPKKTLGKKKNLIKLKLFFF